MAGEGGEFEYNIVTVGNVKAVQFRFFVQHLMLYGSMLDSDLTRGCVGVCESVCGWVSVCVTAGV